METFLSRRLAPVGRTLQALWQQLPFRAMLLVVVGLFFVKEQYPFSNFPMYSKVDQEADILYITDQTDQALPMDAVFRTGSGTSKKMYKKELTAVTHATGRKLDDATPEDRATAGRAVMTTLMKRTRSSQMPPNVSQLRFYRKTFRLENGTLAHLEPERLAAFPFPPAGMPESEPPGTGATGTPEDAEPVDSPFPNP